MKKNHILNISYAGLMAALCYVGYAIFPAINANGTKVHIGNAFVVLGALLLGGVYGGLAGAVGLSLADILTGYGASAPRTFICKLLIGLVVGLIAHKIGKISKSHDKGKIALWSAIAAIGGLAFNCVFEPTLKYFWFTILIPDAEKAAKAIDSLVAITTYTTIINAVINSVIAIILYNAIRPALNKADILPMIRAEENKKAG